MAQFLRPLGSCAPLEGKGWRESDRCRLLTPSASRALRVVHLWRDKWTTEVVHFGPKWTMPHQAPSSHLFFLSLKCVGVYRGTLLIRNCSPPKIIEGL